MRAISILPTRLFLAVLLLAGISIWRSVYELGYHLGSAVPHPISDAIATGESAPPAEEVLSLAIEPLDTDALLARPLFSETRLPFVPEPQPVEAPEPPPPAPVVTALLDKAPGVEAPPPVLVLLGMMQEDHPKALIGFEDGREVWLDVGDTAEGWRLSAIRGETVAFMRDGRTLSLDLRR